MASLDYDTRLGAYVVAVASGRVLLTRLGARHGSQWTLPGGGVELDESVEQAAVREVEEETGLIIALGGPLGVITSTKAVGERLDDVARPLKMVRILFDATVVGGVLRPEASGTTVGSTWFTLDEVANLERRPYVDRALDLWRAQPAAD